MGHVTARQALFASITCSRTGSPMVGRFVLGDAAQGWVLVGASRQRPGSVLPKQGGEAARGRFALSDRYPGCPNCGAGDFVSCGRCGQLGCWDSASAIFTCPSCGNSGPVEGLIDRVTEV